MSNESNIAKDTNFVSSVQPDMKFIHDENENIDLLTASIHNSIIQTENLKKKLKRRIVNDLNTSINANINNCSFGAFYRNIPDDVINIVGIYYNTKGYKVFATKRYDESTTDYLNIINIYWCDSDVETSIFDMSVADKELENIELPTAEQLRRYIRSGITKEVNRYYTLSDSFSYMCQIKAEQKPEYEHIGSSICAVDRSSTYKIYSQHPLGEPKNVTYFFRIWRGQTN